MTKVYKAYALPQKFRMTARGMKPLSRHYFYFDNVDSSNACHQDGKTYGDNLITDSRGELQFHFHYARTSDFSTTFATKTELENALVGSKQMILRTSDNTSIATAVVQVVVGNTANGWIGGGIGIGAVGVGAAAAAAAGSGVCFTADTRIAMANGKTKMIKNVKIGDKVFNHDKSAVNTVKYVEYSVVETEFYAPEYDLTPFATKDHPLFIDGELQTPYPKETYKLYPWLGMTKAVDTFAMTEPVTSEVFNLWVDGDNTYNVNGYGTTSIIGDGGGIRMNIELDLLTHEQAMAQMRRFVNANRFTSYGAYIYNTKLSPRVTNVNTRKRALGVMLSDNIVVKSLVNGVLGIVGAGAIVNNKVKKLFIS